MVEEKSQNDDDERKQGEKGDNRYRSEHEGARHGLSARRGGDKGGVRTSESEKKLQEKCERGGERKEKP